MNRPLRERRELASALEHTLTAEPGVGYNEFSDDTTHH
jgi:hypothetical protein